MTRINVIPVEELSDQWLIAEYRELPRCVKQDINTENAHMNYRLGSGHMKWAKAHSLFLSVRFTKLCREMEHRGFTVNYDPEKFFNFCYTHSNPRDYNDYFVNAKDILLNRERLIERYRAKPDFYRWTGRNKPQWLNQTKGEK